MKIESTPLRDVFVIMPEVHEDARGFFMETFRADELAAAGISETFVQDNHSRSTQKNVLRGLHFQWDAPMAKLMRVTCGSAFLVAVDLRKGSPTLGKWFGIECSEDNKKQLYAPGSFARGFQTLTDVCEVQYKCTAFFNPETQGEIRWNDPEIGITWPLAGEPLMSERSANAPGLAEWLALPEANIFTY